MKYSILVVVLGAWGRGKTIGEAAKMCLKAGGQKKQAANVFLVLGDEAAEVDESGFIVRDSYSENEHILTCKLGNLL